MRNNIAYRLGYIMKKRRYDGKSLSKDSKVSESSISNYLNGHAEPTRRTLLKLAATLQVSVEWLSGFTRFDDIYMESTDSPDALVKLYSGLNERHRRYLLETAVLLNTVQGGVE